MLIGLAALMALYFGGGGAFSFEKAFEPFVKEIVSDEVRYEQIVEETKQADKNLAQFQKEVTEVWAKELKTLMADFDTSEKQFRDFAARADRSRTAIQQSVLDTRFAVVGIMTEDEWKAMHKAIDEKRQEAKKQKS